MPEERDPRGGHARYGHSGAGGGHQDQAERKDEGWRSRQGEDQSHPAGRRGQPEEAARPRTPAPPQGTNTQGELPGIADASHEALERLEQQREPRHGASEEASEEARAAMGTDQPPRMGGPLGADPKHDLRLPGGVQSSETRGTGAGGFDRGVNAKVIGAVHQGAREEDPRDGPAPDDPGAVSGAPPGAKASGRAVTERR
jgi:hypothetical protein